MLIGELRRSLFVDYSCMWNGLVRDVTAELEVGEEVSEVDTLRKLLEFLQRSIGLDRDFSLDEGSRVQNIFATEEEYRGIGRA